LAAAELPESLDSASREATKQAIDEAFVYGFRSVMVVAIVLAVMSALSAWVIIEGKATKGRA